jgi:hypothetical protein
MSKISAYLIAASAKPGLVDAVSIALSGKELIDSFGPEDMSNHPLMQSFDWPSSCL